MSYYGIILGETPKQKHVIDTSKDGTISVCGSGLAALPGRDWPELDTCKKCSSPSAATP